MVLQGFGGTRAGHEFCARGQRSVTLMSPGGSARSV